MAGHAQERMKVSGGTRGARPRCARSMCSIASGLALALTTLLTQQRAFALAPESPTIVSLRLSDVPAREAYETLARMANLRVRYHLKPPPENRRVTLTFIHEPLWEAMARIERLSGMRVGSVRREPGHEIWLTPVENLRNRLHVGTAVDGLFLGSLYDEASSEAELRAAPDITAKHASHLSVSLRTEPKLRALMWHSIDVEEIIDESGRPIEQQNLGKSVIFYDGSATTILRLAERPWPRRIGRLQMRGKVLAAIKSEVAKVENLMLDNPPTVSAGGFRIETSTRKSELGRKIVLDMTREGNVTTEWLRPASRLAVLEPIVFDSNGRRFILHTRDRDWFGRSCRLQLETQAPHPQGNQGVTGGPQKLVMEIPTDVFEYDVKLEFKDVSLH